MTGIIDVKYTLKYLGSVGIVGPTLHEMIIHKYKLINIYFYYLICRLNCTWKFVGGFFCSDLITSYFYF